MDMYNEYLKEVEKGKYVWTTREKKLSL
jgi:hypothetical protein